MPQCQRRTDVQRWLASICMRPASFRFVRGECVGAFCGECWREKEQFFAQEFDAEQEVDT